ncbi:sensor histidine kinase [Gemmatimonadota bacterium]
MTGRIRFWQVFRRNYLLPELASIFLIPIPIAAILLWAETGIWGVLLLTLPLLAASYGIRAVFERGQLAERMERERHLTQLGTSAASILHEVQKPISRIVAEADLAAAEIPESADRFARLRDWAREAGEVANELLMVLSGRVVAERFILEEFVEALIRDLPASQQERITTRIEIPPEQMVSWDMRGIRLVLENIIINAFEAESGAITFSVTIPEAASAGGRWRKKNPRADRVAIQVSDAGTGLPQTDNEKIFEPLFTTKPTGAGLGLFLSNQMIKAHGGELSAIRNRDGGSTFTVMLPIEVATSPPSV